MIDNYSMQSFLSDAKLYVGKIDGDFGPASKAARDKQLTSLGLAIAAWSDERRTLALAQWMMRKAGCSVGEIDGLNGPQTAFALEQWQNKQRDIDPAPSAIIHQPPTWPRQAGVPEFFGKPGEHLVTLTLPYTMRLAWDTKKTVSRIQIHEKVKDSAERAFKAVLAHYGVDRLTELGLDLYGGSYANRPMRGGQRLSMHAYGIALDFDPENNQLRWGSDRAAMARSECAAFLDAWEAEGWISLGRERNFDFMHVQAARL